MSQDKHTATTGAIGKSGNSARSLTLFNDNRVKILTHGQDTGDSLTVIEYVESPGGNPPPFTRHAFVEVFFVLDGRLRFQFEGEDAFDVLPGNAVTVESGSSHTFWNTGSEPLRVLLSCAPAGLERFFTDIHEFRQGLGKGQATESDRKAMLENLRIKYGIEETAPAPV